MIDVDRVSKSFGGAAEPADAGPPARGPRGAHDAGRRSGGVRAVRDVSLRVEPGVVTGLLGPNGAGKTTLLRMITGYLAPTSGAVRVGGHDTILQSQAARAAIGYLPEAAPCYPEMSVEGFLRFRARLFSLPRKRRQDAVDRAMDRCWLRDVRRRPIGHLSKGYRQRVGLAAAILHDPAVVVLDEPSSGLDPAQIREMRALIRELARVGPGGSAAPGRVVLLSSHILSEVEATCDRVVIMARGQVRAHGTPDELLAAARRTAPYLVAAAGPHKPGAESRFEEILRSVPGASQVRVSADAAGSGAPGSGVPGSGAPGSLRAEVTAAPGTPDLREAIARAAAGAGLLLTELARRQPSLEQVFLAVVEDHPGLAAPDAARAGAA